MFDYSRYKQQLWQEYNNLFNKYSHWNDSFSVNARLIMLDLEESNWDSVGGALQNWSSKLTQLKWRVYENIPLFQNAPAITQFSAHGNTETSQSFTATIKFIKTPKPNDMLMFYDDSSLTIYKINDVRFHRTIEEPLKLFECDFETAPIAAETLYDNLNFLSHELLNQFNYKLYDFEYWMREYQPLLDNIEEFSREVNSYFDFKKERYIIAEFNNLITELKQCSKLGSVTQLKLPLTSCDDSCENADRDEQTQNVFLKLLKLKEITC